MIFLLFFWSEGIYILSMKGFHIFLFHAVLSLVFPVALSALDMEYQGIDGEVGFLWKHNEGYDKEKGDSGPDIFTFFPGVSAFFTIDENWFFKPSLFLYSEILQYLPERDYTIPVDQSNIDSMSVLGIMLEPAAGYSWIVKEKHVFGVQAGLGFNFQIPLWGPGDEDRKDMMNSLVKELFYLNPGFWYYNPMTERFGFTFRTEVCLPVYNLFIDRGLPFSDGLVVMGMVGIRVIVQ
jgi:hypothetical protein